MNIKGTVKNVLGMQKGVSKTGNEWQKQEFVIETEGQYPKTVAFTLFGDKVDRCPKVGEVVDVYFDLESREFNGKWYHNINAYRVERPQNDVGAAQTQQPTNYPPQSTPPQNANLGQQRQPSLGEDDMPF